MELPLIELREEYHREVHRMKPRWWMKYGILTVFFVLVTILVLSVAVRYPDVIYTEVRLTTSKPSVRLPLPPGSQIGHLLVKDNEIVNAGQHLLVINNAGRYQDVISLKGAIAGFSFARDSMLLFFERFQGQDWQLGNLIENDWIAFTAALLEYYKIESLASYQSRIGQLQKELQQQQQLYTHYEQLARSGLQQQALMDDKLATDSLLFREGVISKMSYNGSRREYLNNYRSIQQSDLALKQAQLEMVRLENSIAELRTQEKERRLEQQVQLRAALNQLRSSLAQWEKSYVLSAPVGGQISFLQPLKEGGFTEGNALIVTPKEKHFYGSLNIPFTGAGKVVPGQQVIIKLTDYPYREYGILSGRLTELAPVAGESYYLGKVNFQTGSRSSFAKTINLKENMSGTAEIVTHDRHLLGRLFEKVIYAFKR